VFAPIAVAAGLVAAAAPASASATFCQTAVVHDYMKPLEQTPAIRPVPLDGHLPFGPARVFVGRANPLQLLVGPSEAGFSLSFSPYYRGAKYSPLLNWIVEARFASVDRRGETRELLGIRREDVKRLRSDESGSGRLLLSFDVKQPGLYRVEMTIERPSGKRLVRYGEYIRMVPRRENLRLALPTAQVRPGEVVSPWLENRGTESLFYGLGYAIERWNGSAWEPVPLPFSAVPAIGLGTGPGRAASCWSYQVPSDATPGRYRFVLRLDRGWGIWSAQEREATLTAEFEVTPSA
jgi:hypothetical protein